MMRRINPAISAAVREGRISNFAGERMQEIIERKSFLRAKILRLLGMSLPRQELDALLERVRTGNLSAGDFANIALKSAARNPQPGAARNPQPSALHGTADPELIAKLLGLPKEQFEKGIANAIRNRAVSLQMAKTVIARKMAMERKTLPIKTFEHAALSPERLLAFVKNQFR